ncbi:MAG TPA: hypothetical protein VM686_08180, partial [Polyangiaceae bacterium]|nr:hypothetical protein [Polyangiaceae bacterium]
MSFQRCFECVRASRGLTLVCALTALPNLHCGSSDSNGGPAGSGSATSGGSGSGSGGRGSGGSAGGKS